MRGFYFTSTSPVDGAPLVTILTRGSVNPKTGDVIQSWILREDIPPRVALEDGRDVSICGSCVQRPFLGGRCYVRLHEGVINVWNAYHRGAYRSTLISSTDRIRAWAGGRPLRLGSYGDPAMVPIQTWWMLIHAIGGRLWTGFSHCWREPWAQEHRALCMASVESPEEAAQAQAAGWRTFRTALYDGGPVARNELWCPASSKMGKRLTCRRCAACHGNPHNRDASKVGSIVIIEHGPRSREFRGNLSHHKSDQR